METNIDQPTGVIVKSDQTGRTRYTPQYKREVLAAFKASSPPRTGYSPKQRT